MREIRPMPRLEVTTFTKLRTRMKEMFSEWELHNNLYLYDCLPFVNA